MQLTMKTKLTELLRRKVPILAWLPKYNVNAAVSDVLAGITVGLTLIPQAIAYASLAGLNPKVSDKNSAGHSLRFLSGTQFKSK